MIKIQPVSIRCLIIDEMHPSIEGMLKDIEVIADYEPDISRAEILEKIHAYEGVIVRSKINIDREFLDRAINLRLIARAGAGLDKLDLEEIEKREIVVLNAPEGNRDALGEHAVGLVLAMLNKFAQGDYQIRNGIWDREGNRGYELGCQTVSLIGYGNMGKATAKRLKAFGCKILAFDKYQNNYSDEYVEQASMERIFDETDILSLHVPLTSETKDLCDDEFWTKFRKPIWFVNTARGPISAFFSILKGLESGRIRGAALDVLENEKLHKMNEAQMLVFQKLKERRDVLFTPHVGGWSYESYKRINEVLVNKIEAFIMTLV